MDTSFLKNMRFFNMEDGLNVLRRGGVITMSWGIDLITELKKGGECRGMAFNVNGNHFQGTIVLTVNFMDYYEIRLVKEGNIIDVIEDVFVDDLIRIIDERIEKLDCYKV